MFHCTPTLIEEFEHSTTKELLERKDHYRRTTDCINHLDNEDPQRWAEKRETERSLRRRRYAF